MIDIQNTYLYKVSLFFSKIFDFYYNIFSVPYLCYLSGDNNENRISIFSNYLFFLILNTILKNIIKSERPCLELGLDYCPKDYDIPSGHSFSGVYFSLLLIYKNQNNVFNYISILPFILQPFFRYYLKVHSMKGVIFGSLNGFLCYLFCLK